MQGIMQMNQACVLGCLWLLLRTVSVSVVYL